MPVKNVHRLSMLPASQSSGAEPVQFAEAFGAKDFLGKWGHVEYVTVPPGSAIPVHKHEVDEEIYFVLEGEGVLTTDGEEVQVGPGDLASCRSGSSHGLRNTKAAQIELIVVGIPV